MTSNNRYLLLLTDQDRKDRVRMLAELLKGPSLSKGLCPHTVNSPIEHLQYDQNSPNDGRLYKHVRRDSSHLA